MPDRLLVTHNGTFHLDDVMAFAVLQTMAGDASKPLGGSLVRTRDPALIAQAYIVWDVGQEYDEEGRRFDHHQANSPRRPNGTPYSSAGLVWRAYGEEAVRACIGIETDPQRVRAIAELIDSEIVQRIDELDNGVGPAPGSLDLSSIVHNLNPAWNSPQAPGAEDLAFLQAADLVGTVLRSQITSTQATLDASEEVLAAYNAGTEPGILVLERKMPWQDDVLDYDLDVRFAIYPAPGGNWMLDTVPRAKGSFEQRHPLPAAWAGLRQADLASVTGVPDAVFAHQGRFIAAAGSREGALALARLAKTAAASPPI